MKWTILSQKEKSISIQRAKSKSLCLRATFVSFSVSVDSEVFSDLFVSEIKHSPDKDSMKLSEVTSQKKRRKKNVDEVLDGNVTEKVNGDGNVTEKVYSDGNVTEKVYGDGFVTEKVFSCEECGKIFQKSKGLASHRITHVAEKRLFACMFCDKGFYVHSNLTAHLRIHTGMLLLLY